MLKVQNINTYYSGSHILHDVSLEVHQGEIVVLLGRNGVGKTTTLKSIMGIQPPKTGQIIYKGEDITGKQPYQNVRKGLAIIPEDRCVIPNLTVEENLKLGILHKKKKLNVPEQFDMVYQYFPQAENTDQADGRKSVRRGATDVDHCPRHDIQSGSDDDR